jgi:ATP-dependent 26S proteasome regulatory subunit
MPYQHVKLPDDTWRELGESLVLDPQVRNLLLRFGLYRFSSGYRRQGYGLMTINGLPGTGKSDAVRWAGDAAIRNLGGEGNGLIINAEALFDEHLGQSQKLVAQLFEEISFSAARVNTVVIWDDADGIFLSRERSLSSGDPTDVMKATTALLHGLDRLRFENVLQYATVNIQGVVDEAIASRSDYLLHFALPGLRARYAILENLLMGTAGQGVCEALAEATEGWSGRALSRINLLAFLTGIGRTVEELTAQDYLAAVGLLHGDETREGAVEEDVRHEDEPLCTMKSLVNGFQAVSPRTSRSLWPFSSFGQRQST